MKLVLDDLDAEQLAAARAVRGPVCIVAGAGTGKTRTVTHRIAHAVSSGEIDPGSALAITHSRKSATELAARLARLGVPTVDARTFHAAGLRVAAQFWSRTGRPGSSPKVASERETWGLWRTALRAASPVEPDTAGQLPNFLRDVIDEVGWARSRLVGISDYPAAALSADRHPGVSGATVTDAWTHFSESKARLGIVDFADLLEIAADLLAGHADVAARVRRRWSYVTVDEYQDTDPAQQHLLDAVLGDGDDLCVVGDARQAIYSWKGADATYLSGFAGRYPTARVFELTRNYRSSPQILEWANRVAADGRSRPLVATRPAGPVPQIRRCEDEGGETRWVVAQVARTLAAGTAASEIAVLYRFNSTQARFEAALAESDIAAVAAEDTTFFDRLEVKVVLDAVAQAARSRPDQPGLALLDASLKGAGFDRGAPPPGHGAARNRWESHQALLDLVASWPQAAVADAAAVLRHLEQLAARTHEPRGAGVTLATLHRAKGLEWDVVFVVGAHDGAIPASYATTADAEAEEERLLHVAMTRARRQLYLTWAVSNARGWTNRPSPYFDLLPGHRRPAQPSSGSASKAATGGGSRARGRPSTAGRASEGAGGAALPSPRWGGDRGNGVECPHCTEPLKGISARRLGICAHCVTQAPGATGRRARALAEVVDRAAAALGVPAQQLVTPAGLLRLLDQRPGSADEMSATPGVNLPPVWAAGVASILGE